MDKNAYPQDEYGLYIDSPRNVNKWMQSMRDTYAQAQSGLGWENAFDNVTADWDDMEKQDFKRWLSFYQQDAHNKYKTAQFAPSHIENGGSFIPNVDHLRSALPNRVPDMSPFVVHQDVNNVQERQLQKEHIEKKIQSLIGRLNSAEKIATNPQVQVALKKCLQMSVEEWVSMLQKLKREIQLAPMRVSTSSLIEDIIYKNANQIYSSGNRPAAVMLLKVAQGIIPMAPGAVPPMTPGDVPMGGQPVGEEEVEPATGTPPKAISEFLENLNGDDVSDINDDEEESEEEDDDFAKITVTAQAAPPLGPPGGDAPPDLEVSEDELGNPSPQPDLTQEPPAPAPMPEAAPPAPSSSASLSGDPFDRALSDVKISDIVARLEGIASMFKNRQIARQLSIIDLMMDKTGIAPFFPTLAEAMRSALESNQYCQSRIEEILAKLRGTISTPMSQHMEGEMSGQNNEDEVKSQLAQQEDADKARKQRRKLIQDQEEAAALAPPAPGITNAPQELAAPAEVRTAPPLRPPAG